MSYQLNKISNYYSCKEMINTDMLIKHNTCNSVVIYNLYYKWLVNLVHVLKKKRLIILCQKNNDHELESDLNKKQVLQRFENTIAQ